ncbi:MAG: tetratricopeptide repeat protein [Burkholderiales bacterium]|nr:tetratricopeptide repeat protein [Burkholderiales bacterium]
MLRTLARRLRLWLAGGTGPGGHPPHAAVSSSPEPGEAARAHWERGVALAGESRHAEALAAFEAAAGASPAFADAHCRAGLALRALGRHEDALERFGRALAARHDHLPALAHQGLGLLELQRFEEAEDSFKLLLAHDPRSAEACCHLGTACWRQGRGADAIEHFRRAAEIDPGMAPAHVSLAGLLFAEGRYAEAEAACAAAVATHPDIPELHLNWGLALGKLGRVEDAAARFERAAALRPGFAEAHFNLGNARRDLGRGAEAAADYERALEIKPDYADACTNLGSVLAGLGEIERALACYRRAQALDPAAVEPLHNMGLLHARAGELAAAIGCYEQAQRVMPGHPESELNLGLTLLQSGELARGWPLYESRFRQANPALGAAVRPFPFPRWQGESLAGRSIVVWGEQGVGDEILFASMYEEVAAAARVCVLECAPKLASLFARSFPAARVLPRSDPPHRDAAAGHDFQCPAGSLARWLRPALASFPPRRAYLVPRADRVNYWRSRVAGLGPGLKVGFSWRSSNLAGERAEYCTTLDLWGPVFTVPGVHFVNLQYDECAGELAAARARFEVPLHAFPGIDLYNDLEEAAALTAACDLVITAPTAAAFLAGALGVPTWEMTYGADWAKHGTAGYPWFPAITLYHRFQPRRWEAILAEIGSRLRALVTEVA